MPVNLWPERFFPWPLQTPPMPKLLLLLLAGLLAILYFSTESGEPSVSIIWKTNERYQQPQSQLLAIASTMEDLNIGFSDSTHGRSPFGGGS